MATEPPTLRARLQTPLVLILTRMVLPALAIAAMAFLLWTQPTERPTLTRYLPLFFSGLTLCTGAINLRLKRWGTPLAALSGLFSLLAFLTFLRSNDLSDAIVSDLLWEVPFYLLAFVTLCLLLPFSVSLWQLIAIPLHKKLSPLADFGVTFACMATLFVVGPICAMALDALHVRSGAIWITGIVCFCVLLLAGAFHILWLLGCALVKRITLNPYVKFFALLFGTLLLPLAGLLLNRIIPFPSDLQSLWCYLLTGLTANVLLLPDDLGFKGRVLGFFRWVTLPFTLYFFILFLPFAPLALPAMLFIGAGILLLAPTILLGIHIPALCRSARCFTTRWGRWGTALLGIAILPAMIMIPIERDRAYVRPLIAAIAEPDTTASVDALPIPEEAARHIAQRLLERDYAKSRFPFINHWADYRLFGGLYPRADVLESLGKRLNIPSPAHSPRTIRWLHIRSKTATVETDLRGVGTTQLTVALTIPPLDNAEEFRAPIQLDDGVWVTGLRLKMPQGGPWREGLLCDRRAATWIYERLTERNIDPALLTLDTLTQGTLRVSPVNEPRHVEIDLLMPSPTWSSTPITIGEVAVTVPDVPTPEVNDPRPTATVCFVGPGAQAPLPAATLYVTATPIITVTETAPETLPTEGAVDCERALRFAQGAAYTRNLRLTEAIYVGDGWEKASFTPEPPRRALPTLAPDEPWQHGAIAAQLSEARRYAPHPEYATPLFEAIAQSKALMPRFAYIVVETEAQERALITLDAIAQQTPEGVDFDTPVKQSTPTFALLLIALLPLFLWRRRTA